LHTNDVPETDFRIGKIRQITTGCRIGLGQRQR